MSQEQILHDYYLNAAIKSRDEAIELLKNRNFDKLHYCYAHWFNKKQKTVSLQSTQISEVIKELSEITYQDNESEPVINVEVSTEDRGSSINTETKIVISSYIYTIVPIEKCEGIARNYTSSSLYKLKHQPNGKDANSYREILKKYQ